MSTYSIGKDPYDDEDQKDYGPTEEVSALDLYNTPHNYVRVKLSIKK